MSPDNLDSIYFESINILISQDLEDEYEEIESALLRAEKLPISFTLIKMGNEEFPFLEDLTKLSKVKYFLIDRKNFISINRNIGLS